MRNLHNMVGNFENVFLRLNNYVNMVVDMKLANIIELLIRMYVYYPLTQ